mmetsp:Transcript_3364/g.5217  ORF Transcript_3364/g.5217 Transcript_3364/m.5217 type:complete len:100 (+) Transcript_3364:988-1287(+)
MHNCIAYTRYFKWLCYLHSHQLAERGSTFEKYKCYLRRQNKLWKKLLKQLLLLDCIIGFLIIFHCCYKLECGMSSLGCFSKFLVVRVIYLLPLECIIDI